METKLGEKLYELRKKHGYSQEALADILNVSRQAISKWECDEALPETTNLIALSKLYGVSLDELIDHTPTAQSDNGISINGQNINITVKGKSDYKNEIAEEVAIETDEQRKQLEMTRPILEIALEACYPVLITVAFLLWGFLVPNGWKVSWTLFITIPPFYSLIDCFRKRSATHTLPIPYL